MAHPIQSSLSDIGIVVPVPGGTKDRIRITLLVHTPFKIMIQRISPGASDIRIFPEVPDRIEERPQCDSGDAGHFVPSPVDNIPNRKLAAVKIPKIESMQELSRLQTELEQARNLHDVIFLPRVLRRKS